MGHLSGTTHWGGRGKDNSVERFSHNIITNTKPLTKKTREFLVVSGFK